MGESLYGWSGKCGGGTVFFCTGAVWDKADFPLSGNSGRRKMEKETKKETSKETMEPIEYSCAVKPHIRAGGNRQSGIWETAIASLLA